MKFLFLTEFYPSSPDTITGGIEARMWYVTQTLGKENTVTVIASHQSKQHRQEVLGRVTVLRVGPTYPYTSTGNLLARARFIIAAWREGRRHPADVVEGSTFLTHPAAWFVGRSMGAKRIAWVADVWGKFWLKFGIIGLFGFLVERWVMTRRWDHVICISAHVAEKVKRVSPKQKIDVIPCGIDPSEFPREPKRKERGLLVWSGRLVEYKRPFFFLDAVKRLSKMDPEIHAIMIGNGPLLLKVQNYIKKEGLFGIVKIKSNLPRKVFVHALSSAQLFVQTSVVEGFGIVVLEALAAGTPVVAPDLSVYQEVTKGRGAVFFQPDRLDDLVRKVSGVLRKKNLRRRLSKEGYLHSRSYDWEKVTMRFVSHLQKIL